MPPIKVKDDIYWVGAVDWNVRDFHGYSTKRGSTYNAFLIIDEKITLFDTVKKPFTNDLIHKLIKVLGDPEKIDYIVVNHVEMDHSGALPEIIKRVKPEKVFCSPMGYKGLKEHFNCDDWPLVEVKSGDSISLGKRTVQFLETRMIHWPDSMVSYIPEEKILVSQDAFGQHYATSERFDDEVKYDELMQEAAKYYANIVLPFSPQVEKILKTIEEMKLEIEMILPDHGVIWRSHIKDIVDAYKRWCTYQARDYALVVYATMWHSTEKMAMAIADGIMSEGVSVKVMNASIDHRSDIMTQVLEAKALVFGSSTLNNNMLPQMADVLTYIKGLRPRKKLGAAFGSFGWSGEAVKHMNKYLEEMQAALVHPGYKVKFVPTHDQLKECREIGVSIARAIKEKQNA
ncbi:FprA family A-type flavoprotein [Thermodesulfatator atlanticus]|uniref:FprA family A-type flavoprotein n=1 Tax=Thermodesulfatator atlanticus TaxID=501497 RepID=UPI0003B61B44|nr:FprA family A-type flavoprotein [Thermodesulfatator atlanticus]